MGNLKKACKSPAGNETQPWQKTGKWPLDNSNPAGALPWDIFETGVDKTGGAVVIDAWNMLEADDEAEQREHKPRNITPGGYAVIGLVSRLLPEFPHVKGNISRVRPQTHTPENLERIHEQASNRRLAETSLYQHSLRGSYSSGSCP